MLTLRSGDGCGFKRNVHHTKPFFAAAGDNAAGEQEMVENDAPDDGQIKLMGDTLTQPQFTAPVVPEQQNNLIDAAEPTDVGQPPGVVIMSRRSERQRRCPEYLDRDYVC